MQIVCIWEFTKLYLFNFFCLFHRKGTGFFAKLKVDGHEIRCIVTNNHVLPTKQSASDGNAIFFYEGLNPGVQVRLEPNLLFYTNQVRWCVFKFLG